MVGQGNRFVWPPVSRKELAKHRSPNSRELPFPLGHPLLGSLKDSRSHRAHHNPRGPHKLSNCSHRHNDQTNLQPAA
jgi:hypothetical protein